MIEEKEIIKEILPVKITDITDQNIKLIKRKLNIYNLQNETNYQLNDFGLDIIYNKFIDRISIFYYYKELNIDFYCKKIDAYKENYYKSSQFLKETLEGCEVYKNEDYPNSIFLFKKNRFILNQDLKSKTFWVSEPLIWSKFEWDFGYNWIEISNICNLILKENFKKGEFTTAKEHKTTCKQLEEEFKKGCFINKGNYD